IRAGMALSIASSAFSMNTCLESEPQIPVSRDRSTTQSGPMGLGSSSSTRSMGVPARPFRRAFSPSPAPSISNAVAGTDPGSMPKTSALISAAHALDPGGGAGQKRVDVVLLGVDERLHVRD